MTNDDLFSSLGSEAQWVPAISLWQPWASWVAWGWKPIETRTHRRFECLVGRRIAIHASLAWDKKAIDAASKWLTAEQRARTKDDVDAFPRGAILCTAIVSTSRILTPADEPGALIECSTLRVGLFLNQVKALSRPVPIKGRQGVFNVKFRQ